MPLPEFTSTVKGAIYMYHALSTVWELA